MVKKKVLGYSILILLGIVLGLFVMYCQIDSSPIMNLNRKLCIASDSFLFPGVFLFCVWLSGFFKYKGFSDFLVLAVFAIVKLVKRDFVPASCRKVYKKYKNQTKEENQCLFAVLGIATVFLVLAVTFMLLAKYIH